MNNKPNFKHALIICPDAKRGEGLAGALQKILQEPKFSHLNSDADSLPDQQFEWSDIDLLMVDLSKNKAPIYKWHAEHGHSDFMPPVIFLAHPASYTDAGSFYRAGASDYLELCGLKIAHLIRSLSIAEKSKAKPQQAAPETENSDNNPFSFKKILLANEQPITSPENSSNEETRAEFLNTGIMDILDRDRLKNVAEANSGKNTTTPE